MTQNLRYQVVTLMVPWPLIDEDAQGIRTVHYLNPNVKTRLVFDYEHMRKLMQ